MRKKVILGLIVVMLLALVACDPTTGEDPATLSSISIKQAVNKTEYLLGEDLDLTGLKVEATYSDDTTKELLSSEYTVTGYSKDTLGEQTLTVTHEGKTVTFKVTVSLEEVGIDLTNPTKLEYFVGESFDPAGMVVKVVYNDASDKTLTASEYTVTGFDSSEAGVVEVTVTYKTFAETFEVTVSVEDLAPIVTGDVYHWMPGAIDATVTASLNLGTAHSGSLVVKYGTTTLEEFLDYDFDDGELIIYGSFFNAQSFDVGTYEFTIISDNGETPFDVIVVNDPRGTSIPTEEIEGIDMSSVTHHQLTEPIAGAPALLITEIGGDMGSNDFIEVFNNTTSPYNLKGHRLVFADTSPAKLLNPSPEEAYAEPFGMGGGAYIYQDYIIEPLSSAILWVVNAYPWTVEGPRTDNSLPREIIEDATVASKVFGPNPENLSIAKFKATWNFSEDTVVFPVRPQYIIHNNTSAYNSEYGLGQPVAKSSQWTGFNTSIDNRGVQIQKVDQETYFDVVEDDSAPAGSVYYRYEWLVTNKEEDVYVNGILDRTKLVGYGIADSNNYRESINGLGIRVLYFDAEKDFLGYGTKTGKTIDAYNANNANYVNMYELSVTPIVSALVYPKLEMEADVLKTARWGAKVTLEYTIPVADSIFMRFIPRDSEQLYKDFYDTAANKELRLAGLANAVPETQQNNLIEVPVSSNYPRTYLTDGWNTGNRQGWFNFFETKPEA